MENKPSPSQSIWINAKDHRIIQIIDQRYLPHRLIIENLATIDAVEKAIRDMHVRGAPLIGVTAAFGIYIATLEAKRKKVKNADQFLKTAGEKLHRTRPTAINLNWAIDRMLKNILPINSLEKKINTAFELSKQILNEDIDMCRQIGLHGLALIEKISRKKKGGIVNILTHCNAGWLACVKWGTATSPLYHAFNKGIKIHVWVDETRPKNQGASLTAWELGKRRIPHTVIADNTGGHLMQHGMVDMVIVGADRVAANGDAANKIGTYLKALAAHDNHIPFYVAFPSSTIDWNIKNGLKEIPIEKRNADEVKFIQGLAEGKIKSVLLTPKTSPAANYGFDVTPNRLITGLITERGVTEANKNGLLKLYPKLKRSEKVPDEGIIKFRCHWVKTPPIPMKNLRGINTSRNRLYREGLIGVYDNGIGFGNISIRRTRSKNEFMITGSQTGHLPALTGKHYTRVSHFDLKQNSVTCRGPIKASSESLTHAAIYRMDPSIGAVIHIHNKKLWQKLLNKVPTSRKEIPYGTPEMALEIERLFRETGLKSKKILVMAGHEEGIITFGNNLEETAKVLFSYIGKYPTDIEGTI